MPLPSLLSSQPEADTKAKATFRWGPGEGHSGVSPAPSRRGTRPEPGAICHGTLCLPGPKSWLGLRSEDPGQPSPLPIGHSPATRWLLLAPGSRSGPRECHPDSSGMIRSREHLIHCQILCACKPRTPVTDESLDVDPGTPGPSPSCCTSETSPGLTKGLCVIRALTGLRTLQLAGTRSVNPGLPTA